MMTEEKNENFKSYILSRNFARRNRRPKNKPGLGRLNIKLA